MRTVQDAIEALNSMLMADPEAMTRLVCSRVPCNDELADHPSCQVGGDSGAYQVGLLGVINGIFGKDERGWGYICAELDDDGNVLSFGHMPETEGP